MKRDTPQSSTAVKMWHDDGVWDKNCIKFEQCIKYLYNARTRAARSANILMFFGGTEFLTV
jgi:hypothetical protein